VCLAVGLALTIAVLPAGGSAANPFYLLPSPTKECQNVPNCVGVTGPWVVVPAQGEASFLLRCSMRSGYLVAGTDARLSSGSIHVWFDGQLGTPIASPSSNEPQGAGLLFHAASNNGRAGSFEPILGCVALTAANKRSTLSAKQAPGTAPRILDLHSRLVVIRGDPGVVQTTSTGCLKNEQLLETWKGIAFFNGPPDLSHVSSITVRTAVTGKRVSAAIRSGNWEIPLGHFVEVQVGAVCET
jgi:hypothetical protein